MKYVLISGQAGSGKTALASELLQGPLFNGGRLFGLADTPKRMIAHLLDGAENSDTVAYVTSVKNEPVEVAGGMTVRELLQSMATDWCRNHVHKDIWCRVLHRKVEKCAQRFDVKCVIIHDVRFKNEVAFFREVGEVFLIHTKNYWGTKDRSETWRQHESENLEWLDAENPHVIDSREARDKVISACVKWVQYGRSRRTF